MVGGKERKFKPLNVECDARDLVAASLRHGRDLEVVTTPELTAAYKIEPERLLPLRHVFKQLDDT